MNRLILLLAFLAATPARAQWSPCYWSGNLVQCWPSTGLYLDGQRSLRFGDAGTNYVELKSGATDTTYSLTLPTAQGSSGSVMSNNGSGVLSWSTTIGVAASSTTSGYLTSTDWTTFNGKQAALSAASASVTGYLTSTDWSTFNGKDVARTVGNLTEATSSVLTFTGNTGAVIGSGTTIAVTKSDGTHNGYLSSADWTTFNGKQVAGSYALQSTTISATAPLTGGGDLSTNRSVSIPAATSSANGYLSSTDWTTFNGRDQLAKATASVNGYLGSSDWTTFNGKQNALSAATASVNGYLTSTDWTTFNSFKVMSAQGDMIIGGASGAASRLAVDSTTTHVLHAGTTPSFAAIAAGDLPTSPAVSGTWDFGTGITVPTSGGTKSTWADYEENTFTITAVNITGSPTGTANFVHNGKMVNLCVPNIVNTATASPVSFSGLPSRLSPTRNISAPAAIKDNGTWQIGRIQINSGATSLVIKVPSGSDVSGSGSSGIDFGCFTYPLN